MPSYRLLNPQIIGTFNDKVEAADAISAAHELWTRVTDHCVGDIPKYAITVEQSGGGVHNFEVTEDASGKYADYTIASMSVKLSPANVKSLKSHQKKHDKVAAKLQSNTADDAVQEGGKKKKRKARRYEEEDDSSSSSSASSDDDFDDELYGKLKKLRNRSRSAYTYPVSYYWYNPTLYNLKSVYALPWIAPGYPYSIYHLLR